MARKKAETNGDAVVEHPLDQPLPPEESEPHRPIHTIRYGWVKVNIWKNESDGQVRFNCTFARFYRVEPDGWGQSTSFGARDLPLVEKCAAAALEYIRGCYDEAATPF